MVKSIFLIPHFLLVFGYVHVQAQKNTIGASLGYSTLIGQGAHGYAINIVYKRQIREKGEFAVDMGHLYQQSRGILPRDISDGVYVYRDYTNVNPLPPNVFNWSKESFPAIRLQSQPDRFFIFTGGLHYQHQVWRKEKHRLQAGLGAAIAIRDDVEIIRFIATKSINTIFFGEWEDRIVPMIRYMTYLDIGVVPQATYTYRLSEKMSVGAHTKLYYYPASTDWVWTTQATIGFHF